ncbi:MAG TPA: hypothetical protein VD866_31635 [Urbifossiella sp.]|nr:hypothetical protein [Urbifossiella sp.]
MAIRKIGSRRIVVDGVAYRWRVRHRGTYSQTDYGVGRLSLAVESADAAGSVLVVETDRPHPHDIFTAPEQVRPVRPVDVAGWVRDAIRAGWSPNDSGPQFCFHPAVDPPS